MAANRWYKWWSADWRTNRGVQRMTAEGRGVWREMIDAMMANESHEICGTVEDLARECGLFPEETGRGIKEIVRCAVADVSEDDGVYTILCRKIRDDEETRKYWRTTKKKQRETVGTEEPKSAPQRSRELPPYKAPTRQEFNGSDPVEAYTHYTGKKPPIAHAEQINHRVSNIPMWCATLEMWMENGYRVRNVINMIEKYEDDVKPKAQKLIDDGAPPWKVEAARKSANRVVKKCRICGAKTPDVGGVKGDYRCGKIKCQAAPPPEVK